jgi:small subunit ribosomal protein S29
MASSPCLRCLLRPTRLPLQSSASLVLLPRAFSTTAQTKGSANSTKKGGASGKAPPKKTPTTFQVKKKKVERKTGKPPAPGERKAMRKRVVLSNTNALAVTDLEDLNEQMVEEMIAGNNTYHGKVVGYDGKTVDSLRAVDAFKATQGWELFRRPAVVLRQESVVLNKHLVNAQKDKKTVRMIIDGERNTGKSLMLVNAMATAFVKNWIVINIPEGMRI